VETRVKHRLRPPKSFLEREIERKIKLLNDAEEEQDSFFSGLEQQPDEYEDEQDMLLHTKTNRLLDEVEKESSAMLYLSSKRLERSTNRLLWITVALLLLTVFSVLISRL
jgi:hypothetical protein